MSNTLGGTGALPNRSCRHSSVRRFLTGVGPGLLLCGAIVVPAYELSQFSASLDTLTLSLILGIILRNILGPGAAVQPGVRFAITLFVPLGIMFYGTRLDFRAFTGMPAYTIFALLLVVAIFYLVIITGARALQVDRNIGLLIASGSAICGASAIAVLSPVVGARSRDTSIALIVTTTAGLTGALIYPIIADTLSLSAVTYGIFCGSTLQQTGIVKLAASHLGETAIAFAIPVKMMRIALLAPIALILAAASPLAQIQSRRDNQEECERSKYTQGGKTTAGNWKLALRRIWFLLPFVAIAAIFSFFPPAIDIRPALEPFATICLAMALAGIGLTVDFEAIKSTGSHPLLLGFAGWALVGLIFLQVIVPIFSLGS